MHLLRNFNFLGGLHGNNRCARLSATCGEQSSVAGACSVVTDVVIIATVSFPGMKINAAAHAELDSATWQIDKLNVLLYFRPVHNLHSFVLIL